MPYLLPSHFPLEDSEVTVRLPDEAIHNSGAQAFLSGPTHMILLEASAVLTLQDPSDPGTGTTFQYPGWPHSAFLTDWCC